MSDAPTPTDGRSTLGTCPDCRVSIPERALLIRYESDDGWPRVLAECPLCSDVVHPQ